MAAILGRTEIGLRDTTVGVTVPNDPIAKLMYYFNSVCSCVEPDEDATIRRLRNYSNYRSLSDEDKAALLVLCLALSPDKLVGSLLFPVEDSTRFQRTNAFFELSAVRTQLVVAESVIVGGQQRRVRKIMMFKKIWLETYYLKPLKAITSAPRRIQSPPRPPPQRRDSCTIL